VHVGADAAVRRGAVSVPAQSFGRPGDLFGTQALSILETPWPGATTGDLLSRMEQDSSLAGNFYGARRRADLLQRLRPDWVTIVTGSRTGSELDTELVGYMYEPGGPRPARTRWCCCRSMSRITRRSPTRSPVSVACRG
jgi:hypothetical protein